jgi:hypothetical protein
VARARGGDLLGAIAAAQATAAIGREIAAPGLECAAQALRASFARRRGALDVAVDAATFARGLAGAPATWRALAGAVLAAVALARGNAVEGRALADAVAGELSTARAAGEGDDAALAVLLEALGEGVPLASVEALRARARARLRAHLELVSEPAARAAMVARVPENRVILGGGSLDRGGVQ